jgi:hypothetical protein
MQSYPFSNMKIINIELFWEGDPPCSRPANTGWEPLAERLAWHFGRNTCQPSTGRAVKWPRGQKLGSLHGFVSGTASSQVGSWKQRKLYSHCCVMKTKEDQELRSPAKQYAVSAAPIGGRSGPCCRRRPPPPLPGEANAEVIAPRVMAVEEGWVCWCWIILVHSSFFS